MPEEKRSEIYPVKVKPGRHDEWFLAALLAAGLFQAGTAIHQMNRMGRSEIGSDSEQVATGQLTPSVAPADKGSLVTAAADNGHR